MAVTIKQTLKDFSPAFNDMELLVSSNQSSSVNFKYVFEIYVDTVLVATKKSLPEPVSGNKLGYCDVNEIVGSYIETQIALYNSDLAITTALASPIVLVEVRIGEEYGTTPVIYPYSATTGSKYAWAASFDYVEWVSRVQFSASGAFSPWLLTGATTRHFLTNYLTPKVSINNLGWAWIMLDKAADPAHVEIKTYDSAGALIQTVNADTSVVTTLTADKIQSVAIAPQSLNNINPTLISLGAQPIITSSVATYTIKVLTSALSPMSETITCTIEEPCRYDQYRIHFLNKLGGFDAFNFNSRNQLSSTAERKQYEKHINRLSLTGIERAQEYDGKQDYYVRTQDSLKLRSDYLTNEENEWLKELINSPQLYLEYQDGDERNFKPVRMLTNNWEDKDISIDKLFKLEIDVEFSHANRRQRR